MFLDVIKSINSIQESRLGTIAMVKGRLKYSNGPNTKENGLYWIYTSYDEAEMLDATSCSKPGSVNIPLMVGAHQELNNICTKTINGFRMVYNGIGGVGPSGHGGLRERILGEFRGGKGTGSLAINESTLNDLNNWRVSFVLWSEIPFTEQYEYSCWATVLERIWRIQFGWPILCSK
ncbi:MAG: hypothetical protein PHI06_06435 [Desulfobulbaceae bacterium]|nr:hypothetical protein [Desulfobulbaceae bacterium]